MAQTNYALASSGATASATSEFNTSTRAANAINGDRVYANGNWTSEFGLPQTLLLDLGQLRNVSELNLFFARDDYLSPAPVSLSETFTKFSPTAFTVDKSTNGTTWTNHLTVTGNNKVWYQSFAPVTARFFRVTVNASSDNYARISEIEAWGGELELATTALPSAREGENYSLQLDIRGGVAPYTVNVTGGEVPPGLNTSLSGLFSGVFSGNRYGQYPVQILVRDSRGAQVTRAFTLLVQPRPPEIITASPLRWGRTNHPYTFQFKKTLGSGFGSWSIVLGNLPDGVLNSQSGLLTIPSVGTSNYTFVVRYTDNSGDFAQKAFTIPVSPLAVFDFCYRYPLEINYDKPVRVFLPRAGSRQTRTDGVTKREITLNPAYFGREKQRAILAFWKEHYPAKNFLFYDDIADEHFEAWITTPLSESRRFFNGGFELTIREA